MKGLTLSKSSWHRSFYEIWWAKDAPDNLCNYFWALLLAVATLPLIAGRSVYEFCKETPQSTSVISKSLIYFFNTFLVAVMSGLIGLIIGEAFYNPIEALAFVGGLTLLFIAISILYYFFAESEVPKMATAAVKAKKNKVCPKIDWT